MRSAARRPGRSLLTIGLVGSAAFLLLAISAFYLAPTTAGTGGFELLAETIGPSTWTFATGVKCKTWSDDAAGYRRDPRRRLTSWAFRFGAAMTPVAETCSKRHNLA